MKLSDLSTDKALDVLCELTPYAANIMEDEKILSALDGFMNDGMAAKRGNEDDGGDKDVANDNNEATTGIRMFGGMIKTIPLLLKTHRPDVYGILSILNEKNVEEIAAQPVRETVRQLRDAFQDKDLLAFFNPSARQGQNEQSAPSAPSPDSE